tara:strand:- start:1779 stop:2624 length:846 start_codon:yes stop_codon:yes gene_type:complete
MNFLILFICLVLVCLIIILLVHKCFKKDSFKNQSEHSLIIAGCARDCGKYLPKVLNKIKELAKNKKVYFIFYENDSKDNTNIILQNFVNEINNKNNNNYKSHLITEKLNIKRRTPRIAHCRNQILKYIMNNNLINQYDFYINMDLDNVNVNLNVDSVNRCLNESNNWDIASISQSKYYYDTWALRTHKKKNNSSGVLKNFNKWFDNINGNKINKNINYIPVLSAFGGFTIYKTYLLNNSWYSGEDKNNPNVDECEHLNFHSSILNNFPNTKFFIIPYMTND